MRTPNIEKYNLLRRLASGGQGDVYLARQQNDDLGLDKFVAIKFIQKEFCSKEFFKNEVKLLSQLNHPNICKILDVGENKEYFYIVMEFIEGINLKELTNLSKQKCIHIPDALIFEIGKSIFEALVYAHHHNSGKILHKDISPHNIMIGTNGSVILIDFGISEIFQHENSKHKNGKPTYLPDNVLNGVKKYDESVDMYSLSVVLYELVTGVKVQAEKDIDLELVSNNLIRDIISSLLKFKEDYDLFNKSNFISYRTSKESILKTISKLVDEKVISENTIVTNSKNTIKKKSKKHIIIDVAIVIGAICFFLYLISRNMAPVVEINDLRIQRDGKIEKIGVPREIFKSEIKNSLNFDSDSCEFFCSQAIYNLMTGHKARFLKLKSEKTIYNEFENDYEKYLNNSFLMYKKAINSLHNNLNRCEVKQACKFAIELSVVMSRSAPISLDEQTLKSKFDNLMRGSDKAFDSLVLAEIKTPLESPYLSKTFPIEARYRAVTNNHTIYYYNGELSEDTCRKIGDLHFLNRTMYIASLYESTINSNLPLLVFNTDLKELTYDNITSDNLEVKSYLQKNMTVIDIKENKIKHKQVCLYERVNGILKHLQVWEY